MYHQYAQASTATIAAIAAAVAGVTGFAWMATNMGPFTLPIAVPDGTTMSVQNQLMNVPLRHVNMMVTALAMVLLTCARAYLDM